MGSNKGVTKRAQDFLAVAEQFQLGRLPTEQPHPLTQRLSQFARSDLENAYAILRDVDLAALRTLRQNQEGITELATVISKTLAAGHRVFLCGCGATGRLSIALEMLWRLHGDANQGQQVIGFMAGGDAALIKSIEAFEDYPQYGEQQLRDLGFTADDLVIGITEGGETPFVIGATEYAATHGRRQPYFIYCNPNAVLRATTARSRRVLDNANIRCLCLDVGPMSICGSTRMQATTVQMLAVGLAIFNHNPEIEIDRLIHAVEQVSFAELAKFTRCEADIYKKNEFLVYKTENCGLTVLTDTTERAPTFSLHPFENTNDRASAMSWCYVSIPSCTTAVQAWQHILQRQPRPIEWAHTRAETGLQRMLGFDMGAGVEERRKVRGQCQQHAFMITLDESVLQWHLGSCRASFHLSDLSPLSKQVFLKMLLNSHSTLVMGRLDRYRGNVMTWVRPSNNKLIDRAVRYVALILSQEGQTTYHYDAIVTVLFEVMADSEKNASVVLETVRRLKQDPKINP